LGEYTQPRRARITAFPRPQLRQLLISDSFGKELTSYAGLHISGRAALYWVISGLQLNAGSIVWMPTYHCGVEVQVPIVLGLKVGFYRVSPDSLMVDEDDLDRKLREQPGPVLLIHYYGFAQIGVGRIAALCRQHGAPLIEDCAHSLFSMHGDRALGEFGPFAIFSFAKTLPVSEGGACQVNTNLVETPFRFPPEGRFSILPYELFFKAETAELLGEKIMTIYHRMRRKELKIANENNLCSPLRDRYDDSFSYLSRRLVASVNPNTVIETRRTNWRGLDERLTGLPGYSKIFEDLPVGTCPLFLPIRVAQRPLLMERMLAKGIECFAFGATSHPDLDQLSFTEMAHTRNSIMCLPIHQQLRDGDLDRIGTVVGALLSEHRCDSGSQ
jgi:perosamine synthetase